MVVDVRMGSDEKQSCSVARGKQIRGSLRLCNLEGAARKLIEENGINSKRYEKLDLVPTKNSGILRKAVDDFRTKSS